MKGLDRRATPRVFDIGQTTLACGGNRSLKIKSNVTQGGRLSAPFTLLCTVTAQFRRLLRDPRRPAFWSSSGMPTDTHSYTD